MSNYNSSNSDTSNIYLKFKTLRLKDESMPTVVKIPSNFSKSEPIFNDHTTSIIDEEVRSIYYFSLNLKTSFFRKNS
ncbi:hypothetical protein HZS_6208 [Henneguya salminicola]|nr:hypothetical protein HZS_6208 [Henneguya salminicola]